MAFVNDWFDAYKRVLTEPTEFFESEDRRDGFGFPLKFALMNLVISGAISAVSVLAFGSFMAALSGEVALAMPLIAAAVLIATPILGVIGLFIGAGILHIFVYLLGGENGYSQTLSVVEYYSAFQPITAVFSMIPLLGGLANLVIGLYGIYVEMRGFESFQNLSTGRALAVILIPIVIAITIAIVAIATILAGSLA